MSTPDHVFQLRRAYQLWHDTRGGSIDFWLGLMADDVRMRSLADAAPGMEFTHPCSGKEQAAQYFTRLTAEWEMVHFSADEFIAQGDRVVVLGS